MKDYNTYYNLKFNGFKQELAKRFEGKVINAKGSKINSTNTFIEKILFEQKSITKEYQPNTFGAKSYLVTKNYFKELIVKEFRNVKSDFPEDGVNGFVEYVIPRKRKFHQEKYEAGDQIRYEHDTRFMYDATMEEILDMIASYYAYQDFIDLEYPKWLGELDRKKLEEVSTHREEGIKFEEEVDRSKKNSHHPILTQEETVLLIKCLRAENFILSDRYLNKTNLAKTIYHLTGFASGPFRKKLSNPISGYSKAQKRKLSEKLQRIIRLLEN